MNKHFSLFVKVLISVSLISYLIYSQDIASIREGLASFSIIFLIFAVCIQLLGTLFSAYRWQLILKTSDVNVSTRYLYILYLKGYFYNNFLPTQMGGDVYKSISLGKKIDDQSTSLFSVFMDRFGGLLILLCVGLIGVSSLFGTSGLITALLILFVSTLAYFPILELSDKYLGKKIKLISKFKKASSLFMTNRKSAVKVLLYSLLIQLCSFAGLYIIFIGFGIFLQMWDVIAFMPIASLSSLIPSFNGLGAQETVYAFLFSNAGVTVGISIAASIIMHLMRIIMSFFGGILILFGIE